MNTEIPKDAKVHNFSLTRDLDLAACCLADDAVPRLPPEDVKAFVEDSRRTYVFKFAPSPRYSAIIAAWRVCKDRGASFCKDEIVGHIFMAFQYHNRLSELIRSGESSPRPQDSNGGFWTTNTKAPAAALSVLKMYDVSDSRLAAMILRDGEERGYLMRDEKYFRAFMEPEDYCAKNPESPLAAIVAAFFHRERLRDFVNALPARHVFRDPDDPNKISFIAEPVGESR